MSTTKKSDVFLPELFVEAVQGAFTGVNALLGSGAAIVNTAMPAGRTNVGEKIKIPYFSSLGELDDIATDGNALTPAALSMSVEEAEVKHSGKAFEITAWARAGASDPYGESARQLVEGISRRADKALIDAASVTTGWSGLTKDVYNSGTPRTFDYDLVIDGKMLWGDEQDEIALCVVHSKVLGDIYKLKDSTGRPLLQDASAGGSRTFAGVPVMVSDRLAPASGKYTSLLLKRGALAFWANGTPDVMTDKDILSNADIAAVHVYWAAHRYLRMPGKDKGGVVILKHN